MVVLPTCPDRRDGLGVSLGKVAYHNGASLLGRHAELGLTRSFPLSRTALRLCRHALNSSRDHPAISITSQKEESHGRSI